jgi:predicted short-subunit dehydrogenase-like oxidoreductase (DUF2520 family)
VNDTVERTFALVGPGRAGTAMALALVDVGYRAVAVAGRRPDAASSRGVAARLGARAVDVADAGRDVDLVVIGTPDAAIGTAAAIVAAGLRGGALVIHLAGARGLDALAPIGAARPDVHTGALHPLQTLPSGDAGRDALRGAWAAVAGPSCVTELALELGLQPFTVADADRARYHAAAVVASNHLVALLGQVERLASASGVPFAAFEPLASAALEHAFALGPAAALTGPVARGDTATVVGHLDAIPDDEQRAYRALADAARRLSGQDAADLRDVLA